MKVALFTILGCSLFLNTASAQIPSLKAALEQARKQYGPAMTKDESVALLNAVLCTPAGQGFALVEKKRGNNGRRSDGALVSVDGIVWTASRTFIDVLVDAGGNSRPNSRPAWQVHTIGKTSPKGNVYQPHTGPLVAPFCISNPPPPPPPANDCSTEIAAAERQAAAADQRAARAEAARDDALRQLSSLRSAYESQTTQLQEWDVRLQTALVKVSHLEQQLAAVGCRGWVPLGMFRVPARCEVVR